MSTDRRVVIVAGSRFATRTEHSSLIEKVLGHHITHMNLWRPDYMPTLVQGGEPNGVDRLAVDVVKPWGWDVITVPAKWQECGEDCPPKPHLRTSSAGALYCPYAGPRRYRHMIDTYKDAALCVVTFPSFTQPSTGTEGTMRYAWRQGLEVYVHPIRTHSGRGLNSGDDQR
jgi:hypothetical protein